MQFIERSAAVAMRDRLKRILPDLKAAYCNMERLEDDYNWDIKSPEMCKAYMALASAYIEVMASLAEET